jgi:hypothetical protein
MKNSNIYTPLKSGQTNSHPPPREMVWFFRGWVLALGGTVIVVLCNGLIESPGLSVTSHMKESNLYRITLSSLMIFQFVTWFLFMYDAWDLGPTYAALGCVFLGITTTCWIGLTIQLTTDMHYILTGLFGGGFSLMGLSIYNLIWQREAIWVWWAGMVSLSICIIASLVQFTQDESKVGTSEHVAFIVYNSVFTTFFYVHTFDRWGFKQVETC